ncbi:carboxypeptidase M32 [Bacillus sp. FSL W7-1360]
MATTVKKTEQDFLAFVKRIEDYEQAVSLLAWDARTGMPKKGVSQRAEVYGTLSTAVFEMATSKEMGTYLEVLTEKNVQAELSALTPKVVQKCQEKYDRYINIPQDEYQAYMTLQGQSEAVWQEAKQKADFELFRPNVEKMIDFQKRFANYYDPKAHVYHTLLDVYEPGVFTDTLDKVFAELREALVPLVQAVTTSAVQPNIDRLLQPFPKEKQRALSKAMLREIGYDFDAGRLDEAAHPFAIGLNPNDVRVTTRYNEHDFRTALFGTIHEGGHALYEQNVSKDLLGTPLCQGTSMGIHESQSLLWEKFIGKSKPFWERNYELLKKHAAGKFDQMSLDEFYFAVNKAEPSLIRVEADELTYPLHVILRYELEKGLFAGEIAVKDLPGLWNEKMAEYLGIRPAHDGEGVLQDTHWAFGLFGYFPSYALGYIYAAQLKEALVKDVPNLDETIAAGNYAPIHEWLRTNVHQYGAAKKPVDIIRDVTGGGIDPTPLIRYLDEKYRRLYQV